MLAERRLGGLVMFMESLSASEGARDADWMEGHAEDMIVFPR